jgi:Holliday junction resolvasome RuvABC endonuclease subunit
MRVLCLDPGIAHTGACLAFIKHSIRPTLPKVAWVRLLETKGLTKKKRKAEKISKTDDDIRRIQACMLSINGIIKESQPDLIIAEAPVGGARSAAAVKYLAMTTAVLAAITIYFDDIPVIFLSPYDVKRGFTGKVHAEKEEVISRALRKHRKVRGWPRNKSGVLMSDSKLEHCADAIAILYAAINLGAIHGSPTCCPTTNAGKT